MKQRTRIIAVILIFIFATVTFCGCNSEDATRQLEVSAKLEAAQPTPTDIDYSLERYNLIRRAYWVNGQREKAMSLVCPIEKPLGYIVIVTDNGGILGRFIVDGKVSYLNSYLTPESTAYSGGDYRVDWLADVDGSYGDNDDGIFFFTPDGKYFEWNGRYLYTDIPVEVEDPILKTQSIG